MDESFNILTAHVWATLPDSLTARKSILEALLTVVPNSHPSQQHTRDLLFHLNQHELKQRELFSSVQLEGDSE